MMTDSVTETEAILIRNCVRGDENSIENLYRKYYGRMLNVCLKYARDSDEAQDMVQEGFIRVFKYIGQYSFEGSFEGWVRKIMVNASINWIKKYINHTKYVPEKHIPETDNANNRLFDDELTSNINTDEIFLYIRQLPPVYRAVLNLYVVDGYSHKEIAEMLDIAESTSRSNLAKARQNLQKILIRKNAK